jgi:hypothetical protein
VGSSVWIVVGGAGVNRGSGVAIRARKTKRRAILAAAQPINVSASDAVNASVSKMLDVSAAAQIDIERVGMSECEFGNIF